MPEIKFDFDEEFALGKILKEFDELGKEKENELLRSADISDQYWRNIKSKGESRQHLSLPLIAIIALKLGKPIESFIYKKEIYINMVSDKFLRIPSVKPYTDDDNNLFKIEDKNLCALKYDYLSKLTESPMGLVLLNIISDSMEDTLFKGDDAIVDTTKKIIYDGAIYAFNTFNFKSIQIRRFQLQVNNIKLIADNKNHYEACIVDKKDINIIGQIIISKHVFY